MAECPSCHQQIEISDRYFGTLFNCPKCSAVYFVDWNGTPEITNNEVEPFVPVSSVDPGPTYEPTVDQIAEPIVETAAEPQIPETPYNFDQPLGAVIHDGNAGPETFQDVTDYANTESIVTTLTYTITISGIDAAQVRKDLKDALIDGRFGWDVDQLFKSIHSGELVLEKLNPIKASIILGRIKYLPLQITWRQDVFS